MSYREDRFSDIEQTAADDFEVARKTWGGWLFVGSLTLGSVLAAMGYSTTTKGEQFTDLFPAIGIAVTAIIAAALVWRVRIGKGWLAGSVLIVWWAIEVLAKLAGGTLNVGWGLFHIAGIANLFLGVRACWNIKAAKSAKI